MISQICEAFTCLPSQAMHEDWQLCMNIIRMRNYAYLYEQESRDPKSLTAEDIRFLKSMEEGLGELGDVLNFAAFAAYGDRQPRNEEQGGAEAQHGDEPERQAEIARPEDVLTLTDLAAADDAHAEGVRPQGALSQ